MNYPARSRWFVFLTFFIALMLDVMPLPGWVVWLRPQWTLLVLIYWIIALPYAIGLTCAFFLGLVLDLLNGTMLGEHVFAMLIVSYFVMKSYHLIKVYPAMQQAFFVFILVLCYQIFIYIMQGIIGELPHTMLYWSTLVVSTLLWPWVYLLLRDLQRKFYVI